MSGPGGYDCSGFVSALLNYSKGRNPHRRLGATGSMPWGEMTSGTGPFMIGWFKGSPGHTVATINGINFESAGGAGVRFGKGARGATSSMFTNRMKVRGFAGGGRPGAREGYDGDMPFDLINPRSRNFLGRDMLKELGIKVYDDGGTWPSGTLGANLSGHDEVVAGRNSSVNLTETTLSSMGAAMYRAFVKAMSEGRFRLERGFGSDSYVLQMTNG